MHSTNAIDHSESVFVEIVNSNSRNIIIGNVYRAHRTNIDLFNSDLSRCLDIISATNKICYICGDFNLDLLKYETELKINEFLTTFFDHNMFPLIDRPTRITSHSATLLDNIFTNVFDNKIKSGIFVSDITDHYPIYQITSSLSIKSHPDRLKYNRSFSHCNMRSFVNRVELADWSHVINENSVNQAYTLFVDKLTHIYDLCFPVHHVNIKAYKIQVQSYSS